MNSLCYYTINLDQWKDSCFYGNFEYSKKINNNDNDLNNGNTDLRNSSKECQAYCAVKKGCLGFTWFYTGQCWLKSILNVGTTVHGAVSGQKFCPDQGNLLLMLFISTMRNLGKEKLLRYNMSMLILFTALEVVEATAVSTLDEAHSPEKLIDNNLDSYFHSKPVDCPTGQSLVQSSCALWVQLQLRERVIVRKVNVFNRRDCCGERTYNMQVKVGLFKIDKSIYPSQEQMQLSNFAVCGNWHAQGINAEQMEIICVPPQEGFVIVLEILHGSGEKQVAMNIAEVKIYGKGIMITLDVHICL